MAESVDFSKIGLEWGYQGEHGTQSLNPQTNPIYILS